MLIRIKPHFTVIKLLGSFSFSEEVKNQNTTGIFSCDWLIPIESGADMISFDAYNNPNNISIIAEQINNFIMNGGYINWGIVPVKNENIIKKTKFDYIYNRFKQVTEDLASNGVALDLLLRHSTVSVQGNLSEIPILHAEKALILANQLSKKLPRS